MTYNVFVLGLDESNLQTLRHLPDAADYRFHRLLSTEQLLQADEIRLPELLERAQQQLDAFPEMIDAIVGYWDFPVSSMVPILCQRRGLRSAPLEAVVKCEHKYWSRLEQQKVIRDHPRFAVVDLDEPNKLPDGLDFPLWLKPVKSASSKLAFHVEDQDEFGVALDAIREGIARIGRPFDDVLDEIDLPAQIAEIGGQACLAEEAVGGRQVTVEGYATDGGDVHVYGIVDSVTYPDSPSFWRYQYPAQLPDNVSARMVEDSTAVVRQVGLTSSTFNIEYFWDPDTGAINLLEVNPRHSQSHAGLFEQVDGVSNHHAMVRLALGLSPELAPGRGEYDIAAKWFLRRFTDGTVRRSPTPAEVAAVERRVPGVTVRVTVQVGDRLSEVAQQDSYSLELANLYIGARDEKDLIDKYERCMELLPFGIAD